MSKDEDYPSLLGEPLPPKCDECASFDCENCPATYEEDEEEDEDDECITGNHFFAFGSEDCEFCSIGESCRQLTLNHESLSHSSKKS